MKISNISTSLLFFSLLLTVVVISSCGKDDSSAGTATCTDGIQNGTETGVDCGGTSCNPCGAGSSSCTDGIQNGNEDGVDCGGGCPPCPTNTTVAQDRTNIQKTLDDILQCVTDLKSARTTQILLRDFLRMSDGEVLNEDWIDDITYDLEDVVDTDHIEDNNRMDMAFHSGTHSYVHNTNSWQKVNNTDNIIFEFPSNRSVNNNNAVLTMDRYEDTFVTIDGEDLYLPTSCHMTLVVDGQLLAELDVKNVTYAQNSDFEIPVELDATMFFDPINASINVTRNSLTEFYAEFSMTDADLCLYRAEVDVELTDDDFENLTKNSFEKLEGSVSIGAMTIQSLGGAAQLIAMDDPSENAINSLLDLDVLFNGAKIVDLEYDEDNETMVIFYKDGTSEDGQNFYDDFINDLELLVREFTGFW